MFDRLGSGENKLLEHGGSVEWVWEMILRTHDVYLCKILTRHSGSHISTSTLLTKSLTTITDKSR